MTLIHKLAVIENSVYTKHFAVFESDRDAAREDHVTSVEPVEVAVWKLYGVCVDEE